MGVSDVIAEMRVLAADIARAGINGFGNRVTNAADKLAALPHMQPAGEAVAPWRAHSAAIDTKALATAQEIALMWGKDRSQFVSRIQVAVTEAMRWAATTQPAPVDVRNLLRRFHSDTSGLPEEWQDWRNDFMRAIAALLSAQPSADAGDGWRSIYDPPEGAPIHSTRVIVFSPESGTSVGFYTRFYAEKGQHAWSGDGWTFLQCKEITHWMPLPQRPAAIAAQREAGEG